MLDKTLISASFCCWLLAALSAAYLWLIALAGARMLSGQVGTRATWRRFAIAIPAHNEDAVIGETVAKLEKMDYPRDLFDVFVVADFCSDATAQVARGQGAICYERGEGVRGGKAPALSYLFDRIFTSQVPYDAVVVFDADTQVSPQFLSVMNDRLEAGAQVVQGQHIIANPRSGWFPALTWAMMNIDNRFFNQGRQNLGLSAKHMGDSICFHTEILRNIGWGSGLTEDYELRLRLLLDDIRIQYEPRAAGYGQAPVTWREARAQRLRWAKGMADAGKRYRNALLREGIRTRNWSMLDGALNTVLPSYSTLSLLSVAMLLFNVLLLPGQAVVYLWGALIPICVAYPIFGLALVRAPAWAYLAVLTGPFFMLWRTWLNLRVRVSRAPIPWVRTPHRSTKRAAQ